MVCIGYSSTEPGQRREQRQVKLEPKSIVRSALDLKHSTIIMGVVVFKEIAKPRILARVANAQCWSKLPKKNVCRETQLGVECIHIMRADQPMRFSNTPPLCPPPNRPHLNHNLHSPYTKNSSCKPFPFAPNPTWKAASWVPIGQGQKILFFALPVIVPEFVLPSS